VRHFLLQRSLAALPVLLAALTLAFAMIHLVPGDPVRLLLEGAGGATAEQQEALRAQLGLDRPLVVQYLDFIGGVLQGDLGRSVRTGDEVSALIAAAVPPSAELAIAALVLAVVFGTALALAARVVRGGPVRTVLTAVPVLAVSLPGYWVGILLIQVFSFELGLVPATGTAGFASLVLPAITLGLPAAGLVAQVLGNSMAASGTDPYVLTARAKGAGHWHVQTRHVLRNAAIPAITIVGAVAGNLLAGAVVVETVFARQGLGRLTVEAIHNHDFPVLQGVVLLIGVVYLVVNLAVDALYAGVDPRVRVRSSRVGD